MNNSLAGGNVEIAEHRRMPRFHLPVSGNSNTHDEIVLVAAGSKTRVWIDAEATLPQNSSRPVPLPPISL
jgi:hypothetical protein